MPNRTDQVAASLRAEIASGRISIGEKLPSESQLIRSHGVSRTVVREALGRLTAEGLIRTVRGSGSYALTVPQQDSTYPLSAPSSLEQRLALMEYRTALEAEAASLAARSMIQAGAANTVEMLSRITKTLDRFAAETSPSATLALDFEFHRQIAEASGNPYLLSAVEALGPVMITMPAERLTEPGHHTQAVFEHSQILNAIREADSAAASAAMRSHLYASRSRLLASTDKEN